MQTSVTLLKPAFSVRTVVLLIALLSVFLLGGAGGYLIKGLTAPAPASSQTATGACPAGSHAVVWYTAKTWTCAKDS